ncbi:MAG: ExbD/TolR family protein [Planctomycetota bacterium]
MRAPSNPPGGSLSFNMTPMIDVVFLLIIFFLVSSHLAKQESKMPLPLPSAQSGNEDLERDVPRLIVNVQADGTMRLTGRRIRHSDLTQRLADRMNEEGGNLQVRIRGDRRVPYRFVEPIMLACLRAGIWDVSFSVYRPEDVR